VLQSWSTDPFGTDIHVFPAVPDAWKDVTIHKMLAEGAFEISASRFDGKTQFVQIKSLAGAPCRVVTGLDNPVVAGGSRDFDVKTKDGVTEIDLKKGETVLLTSANAPVKSFAIEPVAAESDRLNWYGARKQPSVQQDPGGNFDLTPEKAILVGDALFTQHKDGKLSIVHWVNGDDFLQWRLNVTRPGTFRVLVTYSAPKDGVCFTVGAGESVVQTERQSTGGWYDFKQFDLGTLTVPSAGKVKLEVRSSDGTPLMLNLHKVQLIREKD